MVNDVAGFLHGFLANAFFGGRLIEQAGGCLNQEVVVAIDEGGIAELLGQDDGATSAIVKQQDRAVAAVVGFASLTLPGAVTTKKIKGGLLEYVPVVGESLDGMDADTVGDGHEGSVR